MKAKLLKYKWYLAITGLIMFNMARYSYHNHLLDKEIAIRSSETHTQNAMSEMTQKTKTEEKNVEQQELEQQNNTLSTKVERKIENLENHNEKIALKEQKSEEYEEEVKIVEINVEKEAIDLKEIPIYICGAIQNPGVYYVPEDSIVDDVVKLSGGLSDEADLTAINLAGTIEKNSKIRIPKLGEEIDNFSNLYENNKETVQQESTQIPMHKLININTATKEELMSLNGIGAVKANAILNYRTENQHFQTIEDIKNVSGIGEKTFENIKSFIIV